MAHHDAALALIPFVALSFAGALVLSRWRSRVLKSPT